jgi:hypothetical protein
VVGQVFEDAAVGARQQVSLPGQMAAELPQQGAPVALDRPYRDLKPYGDLLLTLAFVKDEPQEIDFLGCQFSDCFVQCGPAL